MSDRTAEASDDRQPPAQNAATTMADTVGYCRFVTVASLSTPTSPACPALPVPPTVDWLTTRISLLHFGVLLVMILLTTMALSLLRLLPAPTAK
jgi:hypothetical protein